MDRADARKILTLVLELWLERSTGEEEWRGVVYDLYEPRIREGFRGVSGVAGALEAIRGRIADGERDRLRGADLQRN